MPTESQQFVKKTPVKQVSILKYKLSISKFTKKNKSDFQR